MNPNEVLYIRVHQRKTQIVAETQTLMIEEKAVDLLENWCLTFGSSLRGSADVVKHHLNVTQKLPLLVDPSGRLFFFPTLSHEHPECIWINAAKVRRLKDLGRKTLVQFHKDDLEVDIGIRSLRMQLKRCDKLAEKLGKANPHQR